MIIRGTVVKVKKNYAIVLTEQHEYLRVVLRGTLEAGQQILFMETDLYDRSESGKGSGGMKRKWAAIAVAACMLVGIYFGMGPMTGVVEEQAYALVSLDINPSVEIKVDENNLVVEMISVNHDANQIIEADMIGRNFIEVIDELIKQSEELAYLNAENNHILVSSASLVEGEDDPLNALLLAYLEEDLKVSASVQVIYVESDPETAKEALDQGVSLGKLEVANQSNDRKAVGLSVSEIVDDPQIGLTVETYIVADDMEELMELESELLAILAENPEAESYLARVQGSNGSDSEELINEVKAWIHAWEEQVEHEAEMLEELQKLEEKLLAMMAENPVAPYLASVQAAIQNGGDVEALIEAVEDWMDEQEELEDLEEELEDLEEDLRDELQKLEDKLAELGTTTPEIEAKLAEIRVAIANGEDAKALLKEAEALIDALEEREDYKEDLWEELEKLEEELRELGASTPEIDVKLAEIRVAIANGEDAKGMIKEAEALINAMEDQEDDKEDLWEELDKLEEELQEMGGSTPEIDAKLAQIRLSIANGDDAKALIKELEELMKVLEEDLEGEAEDLEELQELERELQKIAAESPEAAAYLSSVQAAIQNKGNAEALINEVEAWLDEWEDRFDDEEEIEIEEEEEEEPEEEEIEEEDE